MWHDCVSPFKRARRHGRRRRAVRDQGARPDGLHASSRASSCWREAWGRRWTRRSTRTSCSAAMTRSSSTPAPRAPRSWNDSAWPAPTSEEQLLENQLGAARRAMSDVRWIVHTHHHIDHAGQDDRFPEADRDREPARARVLGLGADGGAVPARVRQAPHRPPAHARRAAAARPRAVGAGRGPARDRLRGSGRPHGRLDERPRRDRRGSRLHLRRHRLPRPRLARSTRSTSGSPPSRR